MPRPEYGTVGKGKKKSLNPFTEWRERRKEAKKQAEEQAAKQITNDTARNENTIIDTLESIDFLHSKLRKEVLELKSNPDQPCGDLEYAKRAIVHLMTKNPHTSGMDLRKIDKELLILVIWFKQSVELGDERAAYAAKAALIRGVNDIRCRIPANQPELYKEFVDANAKYLDNWVSLVGLCQGADRMKQNIASQKSILDAKREEVEASKQELADILQKDPEKGAAFADMVEHDTPEERTNWSSAQKEMHKMMIARRFQQAELSLEEMILMSQEENLLAQNSRVDVLYAKVASLPIVQDPNLLNKYQDAIDDLFSELAKTDVEIDETLKTMDDINGRMSQLENSPGSIRAREVAAEEAERALEEIREMQEMQTGEFKQREQDRLRRLGIRSQEELEQIRQEVEAREVQIQQEMESMMNYETEEESQQEVLYVEE